MRRYGSGRRGAAGTGQRKRNRVFLQNPVFGTGIGFMIVGSSFVIG